MKNTATTGAALLAVVILSGSALAQADKGIYGNDDRQDYFQVSEARRKLADSTVAFFKSKDVSPDGRLSLKNFGVAAKLCSDEPFREQTIGAFCSGSLVAPDLVMTAGHCVTDSHDCFDTKMVFGYALKNKGQNPSAVDPSEVYSCKEIVARNQNDSGTDYAIIKLNRPVPNHEPLPVNRAGGMTRGVKLFVIGHPVGLPLKVAGGASVRNVYDSRGYFQANLDTYGGNSGSAVFNENTGLIEGILVRGDTDFKEKPSPSGGKCRASVRVSDDGGLGEDVTSISAVLKYIPRSGKGFQVVDVQVPPGVFSVFGNCVNPAFGTVQQLLLYKDSLNDQPDNK